MIKDSASIPWEYKPISQLMDSVKSDLHVYDDSRLISDDRALKIIMKCNEKLGERIHQSRTCKLIVENYTAPIPEDLWKIENIYGIAVGAPTHDYLTGIWGARQLIFHGEDQTPVSTSPKERIIYLGSCTIDDECESQTTHVSEIDRDYIQRVENKVAFPLILSPSVEKECVKYSPCSNWNGQYQVDLTDGEFRFSFKEGEIILTYLGALLNKEGEILYPFHPLLNDYYEYSVKKKILEDLFLNSDADVINKLQYVELKLSESYYDAYSYIQSAKVNQWSKMRRKYEQAFYKKWYASFE